MARPIIQDIGPAPSLADPATFPTRADATLGKLSQLVSEINTVTAWLEQEFAAELADGTLSLPALRFAADPNSGLRRKAADTVAGVAGGIDVIEWTPQGLKVAGLLAGTAVTQSATDMTLGRLLTPGYMGLGKAVALGGAESLMSRNLAPGFYSYIASNTPGGPESISHYHGLLVTRDESSGRIGYLDFRLTATVPQFWAGVSDGTTIVWRRLDPERGSNANGDYVRFADGTQICTVSTIASSASTDTAWTYPAAFVYPGPPSRPTVIGSAATTAANGWNFVQGGIANGTSINFNALDQTGARVVAQCSIMAIGRWY